MITNCFIRLNYRQVMLILTGLVIIALRLAPPSRAQLVINEIRATPDSGEAEWLELYNFSEQSVQLTGWQIADSSGEAFQHFDQLGEATVSAHQWWLVETTKVSLNNDGDTISLLDPSGAIVDQVTYPKLTKTQVYARQPDGHGEWTVSTLITPAAANDPPAETTDQTAPATDTTPDSTADSSETTGQTSTSSTQTTSAPTTTTTAKNNNSTTNNTANSSSGSTSSNSSNSISPTSEPTATPAESNSAWQEGIEWRLPRTDYVRPTPTPTPMPTRGQVLGTSVTLEASPSASLPIVRPSWNWPLLTLAGAGIIGGLASWLGIELISHRYEQSTADLSSPPPEF